jgi:hypothetical protein
VYLVIDRTSAYLAVLLVSTQMQRHGKLAFTSYVNKSDKMDCFISCGRAAVIQIKEFCRIKTSFYKFLRFLWP